MSVFGNIMDKIFHHSAAKAAPAPAATPTAVPTATAAAAAAPAAQPQVDVEQVLTIMAQQSGGGGNWQTSIVDLLKLLGIDSSLSNRTALGQELGVHAGADGSAEQNIALSKAVWAKLAENGGRVPATLRD